MTPRWMLLILLLLLPLVAGAGTPVAEAPPDWTRAFARSGLAGTFVVYDESAGRAVAVDPARAARPYLPASTFKVFNALVALDTGAVRDEYEVIRWDGVKRAMPDWNRDQSLASAMKFSAVWFYQEVARRAGAARMQQWIDRAGYGNRDIGGGIDRFWLDGRLRISALEQVAFLRRLADGTLPFSPRAQEAVRRITIVDNAPGYVLHAKTGLGEHAAADGEASLGWVVGWVERGGRRWFFALNADLPRGMDDAGKRLPLARALLARAGALPEPS